MNISKKGCQKGYAFRCEWVFFGHHFRDPAPNRCKGAPDPQNHCFSIKIYAKSDSQTAPYEVSLFPSQTLCGGFGGSGMAHAVSTRQPMGGDNNAGALGIHFLHVGLGHSSPEPLPSPQAEPSHRTDHCAHISKR